MNYEVKIPIAGHIVYRLKASSENEAKEKALEFAEECSVDDISEFVPLEKFSDGRVCYCPTPWKITTKELG